MSTICSEVEFRALRNKQYRNIPRALLAAVIKTLPDYAVVVYLTLYDLSELNQKYPGTVLASHLSLSKYLDKSVKSISRALKKLKSEGFIEYQEKTQSYHTVNIIQVRCPKSLAAQISHEEVDRKKVVPLSIIHRGSHQHHHPVSQPIPAVDCLMPSYTPVSPSISSSMQLEPNNRSATKNAINLLEQRLVPLKHQPIILSADLKAESINDVEQLYQKYQHRFQQLRSAGVSPLNASRQAFKPCTLEQRSAIQQYLLNQQYSQPSFALLSETKLSRGMDKNVHPIRINNNRTEQLLLTIETPESGDNSTRVQMPNVNPDVNFKNASAVNRTLERLTVIKKLKAMHRNGEIHDRLQLQYLNLGVLIEEVLVHTSNPNLNKTMGFKHALNAAAKMIRAGIWSMPKQLLYWQSLKREQQAARFKKQERNTLSRSTLLPQLNSFVNCLRIPIYQCNNANNCTYNGEGKMN